MKRSEINSSLRWAVDLLKSKNIMLPRFGYWNLDTWKKNKNEIDVIRAVMQGWDITDFGSEKFNQIGAILFTLRNGSLADSSIGSPYAEKYIMLKDGQRLPLHYHACKTEDIINRGGGLLSLKFYNAGEDDSVDYENPVTVYSDGIKLILNAGEELLVTPGNSVTITPRLYHFFGAKTADLIVGEVSSINDDTADNFFAEKVSRFADVEEDEEILYPLCNEYYKL